MRPALVVVTLLAVLLFGYRRDRASDSVANAARVAVPNVVGVGPHEAIRTLVERGLCIGDFAARGDAHGALAVATLDPPPGSRVAPGTEIDLGLAGTAAGYRITIDYRRSACRSKAGVRDFLAGEP